MAGIETSISVDDMITPRIDDMVSSLTSATMHFEQLDYAASGMEHINIDTSDLTRLQNEVSHTDSLFKSLGKTMASLGIGLMVKEQVSEAIGYASDLTEIENVVGATFDDNSKIVDEWAQTMLDDFGLSELAAKRYAGTMGAMLN